MTHQDRTFAFVTGCARSGTTALATLLNRHPDVAIGYERFSHLGMQGALHPNLFETARFRDFRDGDSHHKGYDDPVRKPVLDKYATARVVGDKQPQLARNLAQLDRFPDCKVIAILREPVAVARSFAKRAERSALSGAGWPASRGALSAVSEFNETMGALRDWHRRFPDRCLMVNYEETFTDPSRAAAIFEFLDVDPEALGPVDDLYATAQSLVNEGQIDRLQLAVARGASMENYQFLSGLAGQSAALTANL